MPKATSKFTCQQCGYESVKWMGRCPDCGEWNSLVETVSPVLRAEKRGGALRTATAPVPLTEVEAVDARRLATGSPEFDRVLGGGIVPGTLMLLGGDPGVGKCVTGDTRVLDPLSGSLRPITDWAESSYSVLALDDNTHRMGVYQPSHFHDQGVKPIVEVVTRLGHRLRCTPSHPVLTPDGWRAVGELSQGSRLAAPRALPYFGIETMPNEEVSLIAYILSDGSATEQTTVTSAIPEVESDLLHIANYFGMTLRVYSKPNNRAKQYRFIVPAGARDDARQILAAHLRQVRQQRGLSWAEWARVAQVSMHMLYEWGRGEATPSLAELQRLAHAADILLSELVPDTRALADKITPIARCLEKHGIRFTKARTKAVPQCIFQLPRSQMALFLKVLFTCDGSVFVNANGLAGISYSTISLSLARDIQHLLLRFGFIARLRTKKQRVNGQPYISYELQLLGLKHVKRFLGEIGIWGRETARAKIELSPDPILPSTQFDTIPTGSAFWQHVYDISAGASFKALSHSTGVIIHAGRTDGSLARATVTALATSSKSTLLMRLAEGDVYWDAVERIEPAGEDRVYDLTVPGPANFIANDLVVHNSTLMAQTAGHLALHEGNVLYVSAEESNQQIRLRADRLGIATPRLLLLAETDIDAIAEAAEQLRPALVIVDSIQTVASAQLPSAPGSISQVRECTLRLMQLAKRTGISVCIIGHVTKEGTVAGPRTLEHMVDAVLYLEGERFHVYRLLRGAKNRFGATNEVGVFEMRGEGMVDVLNPSGLFLTEQHGQASGSAVVVTIEGTRPMLVEVQALATTTTFGNPRYTTTGVDHNRVLMLLAVLTKRVGLALGTQDIYVNVAGGFTLDEPAVDLGIAAAVASSFRERRLSPETALLGEVGLGGELRAVPRADLRVREASKLGFRRCVVPASSVIEKAALGESDGQPIALLRAKTLAEALEIALD
jgi:DNA repair protein RadA/Sms